MRTFSLTPIAFASILVIFSAQANAQKSDEEELSAIYGDKSTVSIATGNAQPLRRAPAVASVITAEDIAASGASDLTEVLQSVPGFSVSVISQFSLPTLIVRGVGGGTPTNPQILILQNGIPTSTLYTGDFGSPWKRIPIQNIARIEIIRGPGSALYGADAYAGVVNIITKAASDTPGLELGAQLGSQKSQEYWMQYGGKIGKVDTAFYLNVGRTDGNSETITADAATRNDQLFKTKSSYAPGPLNNHLDFLDVSLDLSVENWHFQIMNKVRGDVQTGAGVSSALDPATLMNSQRFISSLAWNDRNFAKDWGLGSALSYTNSFERPSSSGVLLLPPGTRLPTGLFPNGVIGGPGRWERQLRLSAFANYSGFKGHQIRIGLGHDDLDLYKSETLKNFLTNQNGTPVPAGDIQDRTSTQPHILPARRKVNYIYLQDEWEFAKDWALTAGVRHDRYSDFGPTTNPRLALVWDTTPTLTTKVLYGRAFRAPSFNESYGINVVANGNKSLMPETISTMEFATSWQAKESLQLNMNLFRFERKNIIAALPNTVPAGSPPGTPVPPGSTYQNTGNQAGHGLELELGWDVSRSLRLAGNYSYQKTLDTSNKDADAGYAPHHHLFGRVDWRFTNGWQISSQINWVADRKRAAGDSRPDIADYKTVDLTLRTTRGIKQWDFTASIRNLFNVDAREPSLAPGLSIPNDLPLSKRTAYIQAVYKM